MKLINRLCFTTFGSICNFLTFPGQLGEINSEDQLSPAEAEIWAEPGNMQRSLIVVSVMKHKSEKNFHPVKICRGIYSTKDAKDAKYKCNMKDMTTEYSNIIDYNKSNNNHTLSTA